MNANEDKLQRAVDRLPREIQPDRDLWPGIAARIGRRPRAARPLWAYSLAATLVLAAFTGGLWLTFGRQAPNGGPAEITAVGTSDAAYFAQRAAYAESSVQSAPDLSPATRQVILKNLRVIETSMQQIQQALEKDPNNPRLRALLYDLYLNEARLLAATQQTQAQTTARNDL
jgi:hypothetical protein